MKLNREIEGCHVRVRTAVKNDAKYTFSIRQDEEKTKYVHKLKGGICEQEKWLIDQEESKNSYFFVITDINNNPIGTYGIYKIDMEKRCAEIGRAMLNGNPIQNLETIFLIHEFAFNELELETLYSSTFLDNKSSVGVNKQVGGIVIEDRMDLEFGLEEVRFKITRENYNVARTKLKRLVERFRTRK